MSEKQLDFCVIEFTKTMCVLTSTTSFINQHLCRLTRHICLHLRFYLFVYMLVITFINNSNFDIDFSE